MGDPAKSSTLRVMMTIEQNVCIKQQPHDSAQVFCVDMRKPVITGDVCFADTAAPSPYKSGALPRF